MVELTHEIELPHRYWECRNCGEEYGSARQPDETVCLACREETVWELPNEVCKELRDRVAAAEVGDKLAFVPDRAASMEGIVTSVGQDYVDIDEEEDYRRIEYEPGEGPGEPPELFRAGEEFGDTLFHIERTPEEDVVEDTTVSRRVQTPGSEIVSGAASHVGLDPDTVEVESVHWENGELNFTLRGEEA